MKYNIRIQSYASIGSGHFKMRQDKYKDVNCLTDPVVTEIAAAKGKSAGQVILQWHVQRGCIPLAKTTKEERLLENIAATYDVQLTPEEVKKIDEMDADIRLYNPKFMGEMANWNSMPYFE